MSVSTVNAILVHFAAGSAVSEYINFEENQRLFGAVLPPEWTEANLFLQVSLDGGVVWHDVTKKKIPVLIEASANDCCLVGNPVELAVFPSFRFKSVSVGDSALSVNQVASVAINLLCRAF